MEVHNLYQICQKSASYETGITIYPLNSKIPPKYIGYRELFERAALDASKIEAIPGIKADSIVLLHFNQHEDSIRWFWAFVAAGYVPAISPPFTNNVNQRKKHLSHLSELLENPIVLTTEALIPEFLDQDTLQIHAVEYLGQIPNGVESSGPSSATSSSRVLNLSLQHPTLTSSATSNTASKTFKNPPAGNSKAPEDLAVLMLTSGSSGNAKAVCLRHGQLVHVLNGKIALLETKEKDIFLNWIGLDHVANLIEIHLHAMLLGAEQVHVAASDVLVDPLLFLRLIHEHRVSYTFAPGFFLSTLMRALGQEQSIKLDLSCFKAFITGAEAIRTKPCVSLTEILQGHGTSDNFIRPGVGMTEIGAGAIYSKICPEYEKGKGLEYVANGTCTPAIEMRIHSLNDNKPLKNGEIGELQLHGPAVFTEYYNNKKATDEAFTEDGWFRTGDTAFIDADGQLNITGRAKETIIINGINYLPIDLETAIEEASIPGVTPSYTVAFAYRPESSNTEVACIVYLPQTEEQGSDTRTNIHDAIANVCVNVCGVRPHEVFPVDKEILPKSSLGKISRVKVQTAYKTGALAHFQMTNTESVRNYRLSQRKPPTCDTEKLLFDLFISQHNVPAESIGITDHLFAYGLDSIALVKFTTQLQSEFSLSIPMSLLLLNPTIETMARALENLQQPQTYSPVVPLQTNGTKTPLWLIHPGTGDVLVFLNLAKYFSDRPVYALRARGFSAGETPFSSIEEAVNIYHNAIKQIQPEGPYAIAAYSFGSILAFELAKIFEADGQTVPFLGVINLPPHIAHRMRELDFIGVLLHLSYFIGLMKEAHADSVSGMLRSYTHDLVLDYVMQLSPPERMHELGLDKKKLGSWAEAAFALQSLGKAFQPSGKVGCMDVFVAGPWKGGFEIESRGEWRGKWLEPWSEFARSEVRFHDVEGEHYTMMDKEHVHGFQKKLKAALAGRGI
ncbi:putative NRPS-like protein biosynthetic cluster [Lepraria neglecta]|uniref:NRPS-like protein biosynthetic cluster n=1 Tax=Lepraria neglecta TaxID=209136 RepID=A0AAE0DK38_9LECA|nr:putative NRPS-like protein biosynthetic cluster [Lepraria neglecta]